MRSNAEMTAIYDADQAVRKSGNILTAAYWKRVGPEDAARRARTRELLAAGMLRIADDFYHAAFVFQHESREQDLSSGSSRTSHRWIFGSSAKSSARSGSVRAI